MFCFKCGKEIKDDAKFCEFCGQQIDTSIEIKQEPQLVYVKQEKEPKSQFVAIICCLFLGMIGIHDFYMGNNGRGVTKLLIMIFLSWIYIGLIINFIWCVGDFFTILSKNDPCFYTEEEAKKQTFI